jgi:hypothetical protein
MPITLGEFEALVAAKPPGSPLTEILDVGNIYWSGSLRDYIYLMPLVMGKPSAIVPATLKDRFAS